MTFIVFLVVLILLVLLLVQSVRILPEYERGVIFRLGRVLPSAKGPGLFFVIPLVDRMTTVSLQEVTDDVRPQNVITKDNVTVTVDAIVYFKVMDSEEVRDSEDEMKSEVRAVVRIKDYQFATAQLCVTTLRSVCGTVELDELLSEQDRLAGDIQKIVDRATEHWGVKVTRVEITDVILPDNIQRAMARQAEAERERRAKKINAEGEAEAAQLLADAAAMMSGNPIAYQLRMLQTVAEVAAEKNSTLVLPIPIELLGPFRAAFEARPDKPSAE
ncbi:MAG: SPFH domain-containing protein [Egibacteraceae bacterium]